MAAFIKQISVVNGLITAAVPSNVNYDDVSNLTTNRLLGRSTSGTGAAELISLGAGLTLAGGILNTTGSGSVTSVGLSLPGAPFITITGSPVTSSGTLTGTWTGTLGDTLYADGTDSWAKLPGNTAATKKWLSQTGDGTNSAAPSWEPLSSGDLPSHTHPSTDVINIDTGKLLGRSTAGTGAAEQIAIGTGLSLASGTLSNTGVTSVGLSVSGAPFINVTGSPVTTTGTLAQSWQGTLGDLLYADGDNSYARLSGNTAASKKFLAQTGNGTISAAPSWQPLASGDLPSHTHAYTDVNNITTARLLGRNTAGTGAAELISLGSGLSFSGTTLNTVNNGTVTTVSVVSANGFAGSVANASTTPAITLTTTITGVLKGNGTAISAAMSGTDYAAASHTHAYTDVVSVPTSRVLGRSSSGTGAAEALTLGAGLTISGGALNTVNNGTVTSVGLGINGASFINVTGSPVTGSGTLTQSWTGTKGDTLYASATDTWTKLPGNTTTTRKLLRQTGDGTDSAAPVWDTLVAGDIPNIDTSKLTSGTLPVDRGGTGLASYTLGDTLYASAGTTLTKLPGNTTTTKKFLSQTGDGTNSAAPGWNTIASGDLPSHTHAYTDLNNITTARLIGRTTSGTGAAELISVSGGLTLSGGVLSASAVGTVTSVDLAVTGFPSALVTVTGNPVTTAGTLSLNFKGVVGDIIRATATDTWERFPGMTSTTNHFLRSNGNGTTPNAVGWTTLGVADIPALPASKITSEVFPMARGGTGVSSLTVGTLLAGNGSSWANVGGNSSTTNKFLRSVGNGTDSAVPSFEILVAADIPNIDTSKLTSGTLGVARGGTGMPTYTSGDMIYASSGTVLSALVGNTAATPKYLKSMGTGSAANAPAWTIISVSDLSGTMNADQGGTGQASYTLGDTLYASGATTLTKLAGNTTTTKQYLSQTGNGSVSAAPSWATISAADIGAGTLSVSRGGTGIGTTPANGQIPVGNGTNYVAANLTEDSGIEITNGAGSITVAARITWTVKSANFTALAKTEAYLVNVSSGNITATLPSAASSSGKTLWFAIGTMDSGNANRLIINRAGSDLIQGFTTADLTTISLYYLHDTIALTSDGTSWRLTTDRRRQPLCKVKKSADQTGIVTATSTAATWDSEDWDALGMHSTSSNTSRITIKRPGIYRFRGYAHFDSNDTGLRQVIFYKNGVADSDTTTSAATVAGQDKVPHEDYYSMVAGDYLEMYVWQNSGANRSLLAQFSRLDCEFIGDV